MNDLFESRYKKRSLSVCVSGFSLSFFFNLCVCDVFCNCRCHLEELISLWEYWPQVTGLHNQQHLSATSLLHRDMRLKSLEGASAAYCFCVHVHGVLRNASVVELSLCIWYWNMTWKKTYSNYLTHLDLKMSTCRKLSEWSVLFENENGRHAEIIMTPKSCEKEYVGKILRSIYEW